MELAVDLDQLHRTAVARQDREHAVTEMPAPERVGVRRFRWDGRRSVSAGEAEAVDDVFRFDARPHDDPELRKLGSDVGELFGERTLLGVERGGARQEGGAFGVERGALLRAVRQAPVTRGIANLRDHRASSGSFAGAGEARLWRVPAP